MLPGDLRFPRLLLLCLLAVSLTGCFRSPKDDIEKGKALFAEGKLEEAALRFRKVLQSDANSAEANYQLGLIAARQGQGSEALKYLSTAATAAPDRDDIQVQFAEVNIQAYRASGQAAVFHKNIQNVAGRLLAKNPSSFDGLRLSAMLHLFDRQPHQAAGLFEKANRVKPLDPSVVLPWMDALQAAGQTAEAEQIGRQLIGKDKTALGAYDQLYLIYLRAQKEDEAERVLQLKASNNPRSVPSVIQLARYYALQNKPAEMKAVLSRLLDNPRDFPSARADAGDFYVSIGQPDEALRLFQEGAAQSGPLKTQFQRRLASLLLVQGRTADASGVLAKALAESPADKELMALQAMLRLETGSPADAKAAAATLTELVKSNASDASLPFHLARALQAQGDSDGARMALIEALRRDPSFVPARFLLGDMWLTQGQFERALDAADQILSLQPGTRQAQLLRAASLTGARRFGEARADLNALLRLRPDDLDAQLQMARLNLASGSLREAEAGFRRLAALDESKVAGLTGLANILVAQGKPQEALRVVKDAAAGDSRPAMKALLGELALKSRDFPLAIETYRQLSEASPQDRSLKLSLAQAHLGKRDAAAALGVLQSIPSDTDPLTLLLTAQAYSISGQYAAARPLYEKLTALRPSDPAILNNLALSIVESGGDPDQALAHSRKAVSLAPDAAPTLDTLGYVFLRKKMTEDALRTFRTVVQKQPGDATYRYHLALALLQKGDNASAEREMKTALASNPDPDTAAKIGKLLSR